MFLAGLSSPSTSFICWIRYRYQYLWFKKALTASRQAAFGCHELQTYLCASLLLVETKETNLLVGREFVHAVSNRIIFVAHAARRPLLRQCAFALRKRWCGAIGTATGEAKLSSQTSKHRNKIPTGGCCIRELWKPGPVLSSGFLEGRFPSRIRTNSPTHKSALVRFSA